MATRVMPDAAPRRRVGGVCHAGCLRPRTPAVRGCESPGTLAKINPALLSIPFMDSFPA